MRKQPFKLFLTFAALLLVFACSVDAAPRGLKRVIIIKIDGLGGEYMDKWVNTKDPVTGKSMLPWIEEVFYKNGTRIENFYTRGTSLSAPAWSMLDSGQHLQIKGNVEYDRYTGDTYNYLNFFSFYIDYGLKKKADMPATEVMNRLHVPLLYDAFPEDERDVNPQLLQRGISWAHLGSGFTNFFPRKPTEFINEWIIGFNFYQVTFEQSEEYVVNGVTKRPQLDYLDYYSPYFDHISHRNRDDLSRLTALKKIDRMIGRVWTAIRNSSRADETGLFVVSDHGINDDEEVYSQGYNLVSLLTSSAGGGHHVVTKRPVMSAYSLKSLLPFDLFDTADSENSLYLKGQSGKYPTALLDVDGNERTSVAFRNNDLNIIHILLQQLRSKSTSKAVKLAAAKAVCGVIDSNRRNWEAASSQLREELGALRRSIERQAGEIADLKKLPESALAALPKDDLVRKSADYNASRVEEERFGRYLEMLRKLSSLKPDDLLKKKPVIKEYIEPQIMGDPNSVYDLQNYVVGVSKEGLVLDQSRNLDLEKSFSRVDYSRLFVDQRVINNVQKGLGIRPVDFVVNAIPAGSMPEDLPDDLRTKKDVIWLNAGKDRQALIFSKTSEDGTLMLRYLPVSGLRQERKGGPVSFREAEWNEGFPLEMYEDPNLGLPAEERAEWLSNWHSEFEWLRVIHRTHYSNALISLNEQVLPHPFDPLKGISDSTLDQRLIQRLRGRQRRVTTPDLLIMANDHWNFDVISFNPGGNHGSFFRISSDSLLMMAGGEDTGIPRGLSVSEPYDSLSFVPTVLALMGRIDENGEPDEALAALGFRKFPGRIIKEVVPDE
jgi:hypothetical protein